MGKSMTDNECIATYIMGWHLSNWTYDAWWADEENKTQWPVDSWHPDANLLQAMQVADKLQGIGYIVRLVLRPAVMNSQEKKQSHCLIMAVDPLAMGIGGEHMSDLPESAIYAAAVKVARVMEERDAE